MPKSRTTRCPDPSIVCSAPSVTAQLEGRVNSLETSLQSLAQDVASLTETVGTLSRTTAAMTQGIADLRESMATQNQNLQRMLSEYITTSKAAVESQRQELSTAIRDTRGEHGKQINELYDRLAAAARPNWANIIAGISTLAFIGTLLGGIGVAPLYTSQQHLREQVERHYVDAEKLANTVHANFAHDIDELQQHAKDYLQASSETAARLRALERAVYREPWCCSQDATKDRKP